MRYHSYRISVLLQPCVSRLSLLRLRESTCPSRPFSVSFRFVSLHFVLLFRRDAFATPAVCILLTTVAYLCSMGPKYRALHFRAFPPYVYSRQYSSHPVCTTRNQPWRRVSNSCNHLCGGYKSRLRSFVRDSFHPQDAQHDTHHGVEYQIASTTSSLKQLKYEA